jgi:hypothetical protein
MKQNRRTKKISTAPNNECCSIGVANGRTNAEIAAESHLTVSAVGTHRTAAVKKLNVRTRAGLARVAAARQWLDTRKCHLPVTKRFRNVRRQDLTVAVLQVPKPRLCGVNCFLGHSAQAARQAEFR